MDNGKDEPKSDNASKKKALAEDKAKSVMGYPPWVKRKALE